MIAINVKKYVDENYKKDVSVKKIAEVLFVSHSSVCHTFKAEYGITLKQYTIEKRVIEAKRLIDEGVSAQKVCSLVGFENYTTFYRNYKKRFGVSPSEDYGRNK